MAGAVGMLPNPVSVVNGAWRRVDRLFGRKIFNVSRPLSQELTGKIAIARSKAQANTEDHPRDPQQSDEIRSNGALELGPHQNDSLIQSIAEKFSEIISGEDYTYTRGVEDQAFTYGISSTDFDFSERMPEVQGVLNPEVRDAVTSYYDSSFKPVRINAWRNYHVPPEVLSETEVYSNYWHFDPHTTDHMKLFVYLTDVTEDHGPFLYLTEQESTRIARDSFNRSKDGVPDGDIQNSASINQFTGPKGSMALCNTTTNLHRASIPAEGNHRDLLQIVFAPAKRPLPENWLEDRDMYGHPGPHHNGFRRLLRY